jgi:hypothetical protein
VRGPKAGLARNIVRALPSTWSGRTPLNMEGRQPPTGASSDQYRAMKPWRRLVDSFGRHDNTLEVRRARRQNWFGPFEPRDSLLG